MRSRPSFRHRVTGVDMHIGSQITELEPFDNAFALLADFARCVPMVTAAIIAISISVADSGFPMDTRSSRRRILGLCGRGRGATRDLGCTLVFEPGRVIVGNAGILVTTVLYLKRGETKTFVIVDAGMNDLVRPTLYEAHHDIQPVRRGPHACHRRRRGPGLRIRDFWRSIATWCHLGRAISSPS
jgi:diaminopimelate decarboxylase